MNIRLFNKNDYETIKMWWYKAHEIPPTLEMLPEDSTFILELDNKPQVSLTVYLTNSKHLAYLENFVKDPELKDSKQYTELLVKHVEMFTKEQGYKVLACLAYKDKLKKRYEDLGYINTLNNLSSFIKEL